MEVTMPRRFRDTWEAIVPVWLRDRYGLRTGYLLGWACMAVLDRLLDIALAGQRAARPGHGAKDFLDIPSALPLVGVTKGIVRGESDDNATFAQKCRESLDRHRLMASQAMLARVVHEYLPGRPKVRVIQRGTALRGDPLWCTIDENGEVSWDEAAWDWDSVTHPERSSADAPYWSDLFVVVYTTAFQHRPHRWGDPIKWGEDRMGFGQMVPRKTYDALLAELARWKGAHERIRAVIFAQRTTDYGPDGGGIQPGGDWGAWGKLDGSGNYVPSGRDLEYSRYWEPR